MKKEHEEWIKKHVDHNAPGFGREVALCMSQTFPELRAVVGWVIAGRNLHDHAWCVDKDTLDIVDPTAFEFESSAVNGYSEDRPLISVSEKELDTAIFVAQGDHEAMSFGGFEECNTLLALRVLQHLEEQADKYTDEELGW